ncbi:MAG TPA: hypothetical protein VK894_03540, partial [Jiangellales bacterium]|nr:hypothetical protein [Jiangellales bacterium]
ELAAPVVPDEGSRAERMAALRQRFDGEVRSVAGRLDSVGGVVLDTAWISSTVRGRLPVEGVAELAGDSLVEAVDLPAPIEPES